MLVLSLLTSSTHHLIQVQSVLHIHSLLGCKHLYPQRKNHHWPLQKTDWQTSISITLFKPFYTHLMCHSFHSSSQTSPILLNRWNIYFSIRRTDEIPSQTWLQPTFPPTRDHTRKEHYLKRRTFIQKCHHHHDRQIWMRSIHIYIQPSSPLHLIHYWQRHQHFNLIPSLPQLIQVCTSCCLPTRQQPQQLSCSS